ncbi:DUF4262 domain-containing protein [Bradyrhizobium sp. SZCCHNRI20481]|uniref:DUF4262 domain-containing protein n=1 Tax=Bradyrhizobium sp. SZCCHNRI20481 TaxID=3057286 RepID=UPI0029165046|nr:DUF4262 domain-containing protein [Bradyrhizobium sp. SZCCHNRI20481]
MYTALDADPEKLDDGDRTFVAKIRQHGWATTSIGADDEGPGFAYTTGFWLKFGHPELIVFSLPGQTAHDTFWHLYRELEAGRRMPVGSETGDVFENAPAVLLPVAQRHYRDHLGWSRWFYAGDRFECLQLLYPDRDGHFPWSPQISIDIRAAQPDLTEGNWFGLCAR